MQRAFCILYIEICIKYLECMAMKLFAIFLCFLGSVLIYSSHANQHIFKTPLTKKFFYLGVVLVCVSLPLLIYALPKLVAILMWCMTLIVTWSFIPFIPLLKRYIPYEDAIRSKDTT